MSVLRFQHNINPGSYDLLTKDKDDGAIGILV